jgi:hypothetical protein
LIDDIQTFPESLSKNGLANVTIPVKRVQPNSQ